MSPKLAAAALCYLAYAILTSELAEILKGAPDLEEIEEKFINLQPAMNEASPLRQSSPSECRMLANLSEATQGATRFRRWNDIHHGSGWRRGRSQREDPGGRRPASCAHDDRESEVCWSGRGPQAGSVLVSRPSLRLLCTWMGNGDAITGATNLFDKRGPLNIHREPCALLPPRASQDACPCHPP